jgi:arylsulfatase A-like enzyme
MPRPNVLYILVDDLGWGDVSYHGGPIRTPNIDRLVGRGIEFVNHYVNPVCSPTRASLLSGRYPGRFGRHATVPTNDPVFPDGYWTMARLFQDAGYATGLFGKWHLGSDPKFFPGAYGFDRSYGSLAGGIDPYHHHYKRGTYSTTWHRDGQLMEDLEPGHVTDLLTDAAIRWIRQQGERPWFCYVPYTAVHTPIRAPEEWLDRVWFERFDADPERDRAFKEYAAYTAHMDHAVGRLVETLKCLDRIHNTIVVFVSDNGASTSTLGDDTRLYPGWHEDMPRTGSNYPLRGTKATVYEGGIRTPAAVMWPSVWAPRKVAEPLHIVDWMPTFAALLGVEPPVDPCWDGKNILPLLNGEVETLGSRPLYWNLTHNRFAVRYEGWKLIQIEREWGLQRELYHIAEDPYEERDLAARHPEIVERLAGLIAEQHALDDTARRPDAPERDGLRGVQAAG